MSILCKLFGHNHNFVSILPLVVKGTKASTTITTACTRCGLIHRQGVEVEAENLLTQVGDMHLALSSTNDMVKSLYSIANRSGRLTRWQEVEDKCVDILLDNEKLLKTGRNPLEQDAQAFSTRR